MNVDDDYVVKMLCSVWRQMSGLKFCVKTESKMTDNNLEGGRGGGTF